MEKLLFLLLAFFIGAGGNLYAIQGTVRGKATDKSTGENLVGAEVILLQGKKVFGRTLTDGEGNFVVNVMEAGTYDLLCQSPMHIPQKIIGLQMKSNATRLAYFKLNYDGRGLNPDKGKKRKNLYADSVDLVYTYASLQAKQLAESKTGTATSENLFDAPLTGYVITSEEIEQRGYVHLIDILRIIPEIELQEGANRITKGIVSSRGIVGSGAWVIMQDGVRISSLVGTDIVIAHNFSIRHAAQVEIVVGASAIIYGADAFAGVINIITKKGDKLNGAELMGSYGMFNTTNNSLTIGYGKKDISFFAAASYYSAQLANPAKYYPNEFGIYNDNYVNNNNVLANLGDNNTMRTLDGNPQAFCMPVTGFSLNLKTKIKNLELGWISNYETHSSSLGDRFEYAPPSRDRIYGTSKDNAYIQHQLIRPKWELSNLLQSGNVRLNTKTNFQNFYSNYQPVYKYGFESSGLFRSVFTYKIKDNQKITGGATAQYTFTMANSADLPTAWDRTKEFDEQNFYYVGTDTTDYQGNFLGIRQIALIEERALLGAFAQYQWNYKNKFYLLAGLRYDYIQTHHLYEDDKELYPSVNQKLGFVYKPNKNWRFKLFYGSGLLIPSSQTMLTHFGSFNVVKDSSNRITGLTPSYWKLPSNATNNTNTNSDDANFEAARSQTSEFNASYTKNDFVVSINGFYNFYQDLLTSKPVYGVPFVDSVSNQTVAAGYIIAPVNNGFAYGGTLRTEYRWLRNEHFDIKINAAYSFADGQIKNEFDNTVTGLAFTAMHTVKAGLNVRYKSWNTYLNFLYRSSSFSELSSTGRKSNPAFAVLGLYSRYTLAELDKKRFVVSAFIHIHNLTDARYYHINSVDAIAMERVPQQPFRMKVGILLDFNR